MRLTNEYNLSTKHPNLAEEWHPDRNGDLKPTDFTPGSDEKVWWLCEKGHEWEATILGLVEMVVLNATIEKVVVPTNGGKSCISENRWPVN